MHKLLTVHISYLVVFFKNDFPSIKNFAFNCVFFIANIGR